MKQTTKTLGLFFLLTTVAFAGDRFEALDVFGLEYASDPQISPDGTTVVYVRNFMDVMKDRRRSNLWLLKSDGSGHRPLTTGNQNDFSPVWSSDGKQLLFVSASDGSAQIYLRWMDSGMSAKLTQLTQSPSGLSWSPGGHWIAFSMLVPEEPKPLAQMPPKPEGAEWAPAVKVISKMFYRADGAGYLKEGYAQIFVLPAEGGTPRQITSGDFHHDGRLDWTPDGKSILFSANRNPDWEYDPGNSDIYQVTVANGALRKLTDRKGPENAPAVSPDGRFIAYTGYDDRYQFYQVSRLYLMNRDGTGARVLSKTLDRDVQNHGWNQDGQGLYFQYDDQGNSKVAQVNLDGEIRVLAENLGGTSLDRPYSGGSFSKASNGNFAFTYSREHPADVAVGSRSGTAQAVKQVTRLNEDLLDHKELGTVEEIWYESSHDRRKIQGWIVKPPGFDPSRKYPLILEIHGGPVANYGGR
ncbi:MAG: DPP IV N-terminal domain-containing protein, partial [Acidobacteria bacterium]|nr:DPP IV N-terminal domain-containing protein [Acidobacteriota bacterium]